MSELDFFDKLYKTLRPGYEPMRWMRRIFLCLIDGKAPSLVDLPTGAGKTELIIIWLVALAWYAKHRESAKAVPRRLIWVVNRRVLVQQVFDVAESLNKTLKGQSGAEEELAGYLRSLCKQNSVAVFNVVQLRGQRLDDREWSLDPTMPQLVIGTVDQIGSRFLFQGYGQGKWSRPMHAGLFGVDAWVCLDEAHLVPAFAVTLRQIREIACRSLDISVPSSVANFFSQLPFWFTELSATPGLPPPKHSEVFRLEKEDESDEVIKDRLLAKLTRRVVWKPQRESKKLADELAVEALRTASEFPGSAIAVFCRMAKDAEVITKKIKEVHESRVLTVTGRVRGYERDRLAQSELFQRFRQGHQGTLAVGMPPVFLVGTAAAEVGLDADASAIVCDFADLPTLVQRLGRLDRRGQLSKQATITGRLPPTMTIIGGSNGKTTQAQLTALVEKLGVSRPSNGFEYGAEFFTGAPWTVVVGKEKTDNDDVESISVTEIDQDKGGAKPGVEDAITSATWRVLALPLKLASVPLTPSTSGSALLDCCQAADWLNDPLATITAGPVVVPPLSDAVLKRWAATTPRPSKFLPVHPWLYGLLPDPEGTPLVGIAFRLELDILQHCHESDEDDGDADQTWEKIGKCLAAFPPLNSELHFVPLGKAREWLETLGDEQRPALAYFDGEEWTNSILPSELNSNSVLVLPTSISALVVNDIVERGGDESDTQRCWDVFEALANDGAKYRRAITIKSGHIEPGQKNEQGVYRVPEFGAEGEPSKYAGKEDAESAEEDTPDDKKGERTFMKLSFVKDGISFDLRYRKPLRAAGAALDLLPEHLARAAEHGRQLALALAPSNDHLAALLSRTAKDHDKGKERTRWQQAMGNTVVWRKAREHEDSVLIAKPVIATPGNAGGYRHEWGTLWCIKGDSVPIFSETDSATATFLRDLYLHGIAAHHGYFRPSMPDRGFDSPPTAVKQNPLRLESIERSARLQRQLGYWRLAYLESLIKIADVAASHDAQTEAADDES